MNKKELLFYDAYEAFYAMAKTSRAFRAFCRDAFGADFSQDGFASVYSVPSYRACRTVFSQTCTDCYLVILK